MTSPSGTRIRELRDLTRDHVGFGRCIIEIQQRANCFNEMDSPKRSAGNRDISMASMVMSAL